MIKKENLGKWQHLMAIPFTNSKEKKIFLLTADGEKWAVIHFLADSILFIIIVPVLLSQMYFTADKVFFICFLIFEAPFTIASLWLHYINHKILSLPKEIITTDIMKKHIAKQLKKYKAKYQDNEFQISQTEIKKQHPFEMITEYVLIVKNKSGTNIEKTTVAVEKTSKYYSSEIILTN